MTDAHVRPEAAASMNRRATTMSGLIDARDWSQTPLGDRSRWPASLASIVDTMLSSKFAMCIGWSSELTLLYNDAYIPFLGERHPSALGRPLAEVWSDVWDGIAGSVGQAMAGEAVAFENMPLTMTRNGRAEETWWTFSYSPVRDDEGCIAGFLDIATETTTNILSQRGLVESEARTRASEAYWRGLFEQLNEGFMVVELVRDDNGRAHTWRFVELNAAWERISGLSAADARGRTVEEVIPGVERHWIDAYIGVGETGEPAAFRAALSALDQLYEVRAFPVAPGRVGVHFQELSAQQREEERAAVLLTLSDRLAEQDNPADIVDLSCDLLGRAMGAQRVGYGVVDCAARTITVERDWTAGDLPSLIGVMTFEAFGPSLAALERGETVTDHDARGDPSLPASAELKASRNVQAFVHTPIFERGRFVALQYVCASSPREWSEGELMFIREVASRTRAAAVRARDLQQRRLAEARLRELNETLEDRIAQATAQRFAVEEALRQSQKLEAVGQLTGGVAHDFNNLLTIIRSSVDFLKRPDLTAARRDRYVTAISETVERATKLTGQLLAFARRQPLKPEVFDVGAKVQLVGELVRPLVGARISIEIDASDQPCFTEADISQFETALVNLAVNARDAMNGEGRLTLHVRKVEEVPSIRGHAGAKGDFVAVSVSDTGAGIASEMLASIFEPFFTTKEVGKGTGLGLSQVFGFTKQSGGEVDVHSAESAGATFTIYLPSVSPAQAPHLQLSPTELVDPPPGVRVLLVEDNEAVGRFADEMLKDLGYDTHLVGNAHEALAALASPDADYNVVFSDVIMPGMNGVELAKEVRRQRPELPVVLTSGYSNVLAQEGSHGFELLRKPYSIEELSTILARVV